MIHPEDSDILVELPLPHGVRAWLTRGYLRCALLNDLQSNDDMDIVVDAPVEALATALDGLVERRTVHGGFSLRKIGQRRIDLWSLSNTYGVACRDVRHALRLFEFSCDAFAWALSDGVLVTDLAAHSLLGEGLFDIQQNYRYYPERADFLLTKGVYLCLRHRLQPGPRLAALFRTPVTVPQSNSAELARHFGNEVASLGRLGAAVALLNDYPALGDRLALMGLTP